MKPVEMAWLFLGCWLACVIFSGLQKSELWNFRNCYIMLGVLQNCCHATERILGCEFTWNCIRPNFMISDALHGEHQRYSVILLSNFFFDYVLVFVLVLWCCQPCVYLMCFCWCRQSCGVHSSTAAVSKTDQLCTEGACFRHYTIFLLRKWMNEWMKEWTNEWIPVQYLLN